MKNNRYYKSKLPRKRNTLQNEIVSLENEQVENGANFDTLLLKRRKVEKLKKKRDHKVQSILKSINNVQNVEKLKQEETSAEGSMPEKTARNRCWIPKEQFYKMNSFIPLEEIDLSIWYQYLDDEQFIHISKYVSVHLTLLNMDRVAGVSNLGWKSLVQACPNLTTLSLSYFEDITKRDFQTMSAHWTHLTELNISNSLEVTDDLIRIISKSFTQLKKLNLMHCDQITDAAVSLIGQHMENLQTIDIAGCKYVTDAGMRTLYGALGHKLRVLKLDYCKKISNKMFQALSASNCSKMQTLSVAGCNQLSDEAFEYLVQTCEVYGIRKHHAMHHMVHLNVSSCPLISSLAMRWYLSTNHKLSIAGYINGCNRITAACPFLKELHLATCSNIDDEAMRAINSCAELRALNIHGCTQVTDIGIMFMLLGDDESGSRVRKLQELNASWCQNIGTKALQAISSSGLSLTKLDIRCIQENFEASALQNVLRGSPNLRRLRLQRCSTIDDSLIKTIGRHVPNVQHLEISECNYIKSKTLAPIRILQQLSSCILCMSTLLDDRVLFCLAPTLQRLEVQGLPYLTDSVCKMIALNLPVLREIDFSGCKNITILGVQHMVHCCIDLAALNVLGCKISTQDLQRQQNESFLFKNDIKSGLYGLFAKKPSFEYMSKVALLKQQSPTEYPALIALQMRKKCQAEFAMQKQKHQAVKNIQRLYRKSCNVYNAKIMNFKQCAIRKNSAIILQKTIRKFLAKVKVLKLRWRYTRAARLVQCRYRYRRRQRVLRAAAKKWKLRLITYMFASWKDSVEEIKTRRETQRHDLGMKVSKEHFTTKLRKKPFYPWRNWAKTKAKRRYMANTFWKAKFCPSLVSTWKSKTIYERVYRKKLVLIFMWCLPLRSHNSYTQTQKLAKATAKFLLRYFVVWNREALALKERGNYAVLSFVYQHQTRKYYLAWVKATQRKIENRKKCDAMRLKLDGILKDAVLHKWQQYLEEKKCIKRAYAYFSGMSTMKYFQAWKSGLEAQNQQKLLLKKAAKRILLQSYTRAINTWREYTEANISLRLYGSICISYMLRGCFTRCFVAWRDYSMYVKLAMIRIRARFESTPQGICLSRWKTNVRRICQARTSATVIQSLWRGQLAREFAETKFYIETYSIIRMQSVVRGKFGRKVALGARRKRYLREYNLREKEWEQIEKAEVDSRAYEREIRFVIMLQRSWRGVLARKLFLCLRREKHSKLKVKAAQLEVERRKEVEAKKIERSKQEAFRVLAIVKIQSVYRGHQARTWFRSQNHLIILRRSTMKVQAMYRGRIGRRSASAKRRVQMTKIESLSRRSAEGKVLRLLNAKTRDTQRSLRGFMHMFGLDPSTFVLDMRALKSEVLQDFSSFHQVLNKLKNKFRKEEIQPNKSITELVVPPTNPNAIVPGDTVRIVLPDHVYTGETAYVLAIDKKCERGMAEIKLDCNGLMEFLPLRTSSNAVSASMSVFIKVPHLHFAALESKRHVHISMRWRDSLRAYASKLKTERIQFAAARTIQCCARIYLARITVQEELEKQGIRIAKQDKALLKLLQRCGLANRRTAELLRQMKFISPLLLRGDIDDKPNYLMKLRDRFAREAARKEEVGHALRVITDERYGDGEMKGSTMPHRVNDGFERFVKTPLRVLRRVATHNLARRIELKGHHTLAWIIGGADFVTSFQEKNTWVQQHRFEQLIGSSYTDSDGWAIVQGVFKDGLPHGWGVAKFLSGASKLGQKWAKSGSIEARYKALTTYKRIKHLEDQERLSAQILARQSQINDQRYKEGPYGFANRHKTLSHVEDLLRLCQRSFISALNKREVDFNAFFAAEAKAVKARERTKTSMWEAALVLRDLQLEPPSAPSSVAILPWTVNGFEVIKIGSIIEVLWEDGYYHKASILDIDLKETGIAEVHYTEDNFKETLRLLEPPIENTDSKFLEDSENNSASESDNSSDSDDNSSVVSNESEKVQSSHAKPIVYRNMAYRQWRFGSAYKITFDKPNNGGTEIASFTIRWENIVDGSKGHQIIVEDAEMPIKRKVDAVLLLPKVKCLYKIQVFATNKIGDGDPTEDLEAEIYPVVIGGGTSQLLREPGVDYEALESSERKHMHIEDLLIHSIRNETQCALCKKRHDTFDDLYYHISKTHNVPIYCPYTSCAQPCSSPDALRYHIWNCTSLKLSYEDRKNEKLVDIFTISPNYCCKRKRRHTLSPEVDTNFCNEDEYLESKYTESYENWIQDGKKLQESTLLRNSNDEARLNVTNYVAPPFVFGIRFDSAQICNENYFAVVQKIETNIEDMRVTTSVTNLKLEDIELLRKENEEYIQQRIEKLEVAEKKWQIQSLQRDKKKAMQKLKDLEAESATIKAEFQRYKEESELTLEGLTTLKHAHQAFLEKMNDAIAQRGIVDDLLDKSNSILNHQQKVLDRKRERLAELIQESESEVSLLRDREHRLATREKQLCTMQFNLREMQLHHTADVLAQQKEINEDEEFMDLTVLQLKKDEQKIRKEQAEEAGQDFLSTELVPANARLGVANLDQNHLENYKDTVARNTPVVFEEEEVIDLNETPEQKRRRAALEKLNSSIPEEEQSAKLKLKRDKTMKKIVAKSKKTEEHPDSAESATNPEAPAAVSKDPTKFVKLEGNFIQGQIFGNVSIYYNDGSKYEGPWIEDDTVLEASNVYKGETRFEKNHWGTFILPNGDVWEGEDCNNFFQPRNANGKFLIHRVKDNVRFDGEVLNGKWHGYGTLTMEFGALHGKYIGEWKDNLRHGHGIEVYDDGERFEGGWKNNLYDGHGKLILEDGSSYIGGFWNGNWHGKGLRTLQNGDIIEGTFDRGLLNSKGVYTHVDGRNYIGEFKNTLKHGHGILTYANGERYEGPFKKNVEHGEGLFYTRTSEHEGSEPIIRRGLWQNGEHVKWLTRPRTKLGTTTFLNFFAEIRFSKEGSKLEFRKEQFDTPYAVMVASLLPSLPTGVDEENPFVQAIVRRLARIQHEVIGSDVSNTAVSDLNKLECTISKTEDAIAKASAELLEYEESHEQQKMLASDCHRSLHEMKCKEKVLQDQLESHWKNDIHCSEKNYKNVVLKLNDLEASDWYKLRKSKPDKNLQQLLEGFATLLNFTPNIKMNGVLPIPSNMDIARLMASSDENYHLGDEEGLIHRYKVKAEYVIPMFDIYSFAVGLRHELLQNVAPLVHNPRLRPNNVGLARISPAAPVVCAWVRAAYFYAQAACEIYPVHEELLQLTISIHTQYDIVKEEDETLTIEAEKLRLHREHLDELRTSLDVSLAEEKRLRKILDEIRELDQIIDRPSTRGLMVGPAKKDSEDDNTMQVQDSLSIEADKFSEEQQSILAAKLATDGSGDTELLAALRSIEINFKMLLKPSNNYQVKLCDLPQAYEALHDEPINLKQFGLKKLTALIDLLPTTFERAFDGSTEILRLYQPKDDPDSIDLPKNLYPCKTCPGISYAAQSQLKQHEFTIWHKTNVANLAISQPVFVYNKRSKLWVEVFGADGTIYFQNQYDQEISATRPMEMDIDAVDLSSLSNKPPMQQTPSTWEEYYDEEHDACYYFNVETGETTWEAPDNYTHQDQTLTAEHLEEEDLNTTS